jgi:hypothetical protein
MRTSALLTKLAWAALAAARAWSAELMRWTSSSQTKAKASAKASRT